MCDPVGIRTQDPQLRRLLLYPTELPDHRFAVAKIVLFSMSVPVFAKKMQKHFIPLDSGQLVVGDVVGSSAWIVWWPWSQVGFADAIS